MMRRPSAVKDLPKQQETLVDGIPAKDIVTTPMEVVAKMWEWALDGENASKFCLRIVDPCAGDGRMISYGLKQNPLESEDWFTKEVDIRKSDCPRVQHENFFEVQPQHLFHIALMNPPFSNVGVFRFLKQLLDFWMLRNGRVIAIVPYYAFAQNEKRKAWWVRHIYRECWLPKSTFADCGRKVIHCSIVDFRPQGSGYFQTFDFKHGQQELG